MRRAAETAGALPAAAGLVGFLVIVVAAARARARSVTGALVPDRDDDRYRKGGSVYINRDDPTGLVAARTAFGWTVNLGHPIAWLLLTGFLAVPVGLVVGRVGAGI